VARASETLTIDEVVELNRQQIDLFGGLFLGANNFHNQASLEYALEAMNADSFGQELYPGLADKAALLAYTIIQNHVFHDGNKRTAISATRIFLLLNGFDLEIQQEVVDQEAVSVALDVANSVLGREELAEWIASKMTTI